MKRASGNPDRPVGLPYEKGHTDPAKSIRSVSVLLCAVGGGLRLVDIAPIPRGWFIVPFLGIYTGRLSSTIQYKYIHLRGQIKLPLPPLPTQTLQGASVYLFLDMKHSYQGNPSHLDCLSTDTFNAFPNEDNSDRFALLWQRHVVLCERDPLSVIDEYIPLDRFYAQYDSDLSTTGGEPPHMLSGVLYWVTTGTAHWASGDSPVFNCRTKVAFWDEYINPK